MTANKHRNTILLPLTDEQLANIIKHLQAMQAGEIDALRLENPDEFEPDVLLKRANPKE